MKQSSVKLENDGRPSSSPRRPRDRPISLDTEVHSLVDSPHPKASSDHFQNENLTQELPYRLRKAEQRQRHCDVVSDLGTAAVPTASRSKPHDAPIQPNQRAIPRAAGLLGNLQLLRCFASALASHAKAKIPTVWLCMLSRGRQARHVQSYAIISRSTLHRASCARCAFT